MKTTILAATIFVSSMLMSASAQAEPQRFTFDKAHTNILFYVDHLGFSNMIGRFTDFDGEMILDSDAPASSSVEIILRPSGIVTSSTELDDHLQGDKWFNSTLYPEITFKSTKVQVSDEKEAVVTGWLKFLGQEKLISLNVTLNKMAAHPMSGKMTAGFSANTVIARSEWGMNEYVPMVGEEVQIMIEAEGTQAEQAPSAP